MNFNNREDSVILSSITKPNARIMDIGCGLGRYLIPLTKTGHFVLGIDKNPEIVESLNQKGYSNVFTNDEATKQLSNDFDYIILSHLVEHLEPKELIPFFDNYLRHLKIGGKLIIATPSMHSRFYDDYDHIRPYTPKTFTLLFSDYEQHQEKPFNRLQLDYVWFRKDPYQYHWYPNTRYYKRLILKFVNRLLIIVYKVSGSKIAETTGWVGSFSLIK